jgi:hypothetical protein
MPRVPVNFADATLKAIDRFAPAGGSRIEFIQNAVKHAPFRLESDRMRHGYRLQPDTGGDTCAWDLPEEWPALND